MLGAVIGDIVGSPYEFSSHKRTDFPLFSPASRATDDSLMTLAVALGLSEASLTEEASVKDCIARHMRHIGRQYPNAGYGDRFYRWLMNDRMGPYYSFGNGSAMRVSACAYFARDLEHCLMLAKWSAQITHDHPDGIAGAQAVAVSVYLALNGADKDEIQNYVCENFYSLDFSLDEIRPTYAFDVTCRGSVPEAIRCFLEAESFEEAIRLAVSLGGDGDTQAAIAGSIAGAYYGVPEEIEQEALTYLDDLQRQYLDTALEGLF